MHAAMHAKRRKKGVCTHIAQKSPTLGRKLPILGNKESRYGINHKNNFFCWQNFAIIKVFLFAHIPFWINDYIPMTKLPHGLMWYFVFSSMNLAGMTALITFSMISSRRAGSVTFSLCWVDTTMVWTRWGIQAPLSKRYSQVT